MARGRGSPRPVDRHRQAPLQMPSHGLAVAAHLPRDGADAQSLVLQVVDQDDLPQSVHLRAPALALGHQAGDPRRRQFPDLMDPKIDDAARVWGIFKRRFWGEYARRKGPMGLIVRAIGLARAKVKIGLANLVYNMRRMIWLAEAASA